MNRGVFFTAALVCLLILSAQAEKYKYSEGGKSNKGQNTDGAAANCTPPTASRELDINNTRALIQSGGDMWWDFTRARYEIPKGSGKTSIFAGSLWLGGQDVSGQLKVAAQRFRSEGNDFWTGPLRLDNAEIDQQTCLDYDRHFETSRAMVAEFAGYYEAQLFDEANETNTVEELYSGYTIPDEILQWPGNGDPQQNQDFFLAPFFDRDGDGFYDPRGDGDYPGYVLVGSSDCSRRVRDIYGDQNLWWVFNDKGNIHTESNSQAIGMEIRAQAFAFATTDEVNNMTFYNYELINRSSYTLAQTYFGQWVDADLGNPQDDYVGCDVNRGLGYCYNGDENDQDNQGALGYGENPPAIGVDFFQGPFQANDDKDNCLCDNYADAVEDNGIVYRGQGAGYGDGLVDNERYGMRKFLYHNNAQGAQGDPSTGTDYYNYLRGIWKDGTIMTYGGTGYDPANASAIPAGYMFPGATDPENWGTNGITPPDQTPWTEVTAGNLPGDRRFIQSSGPFTLAPGAVNNITVGVVWAQATSGGAQASINLMRNADDKTQALFDACFEILDGPMAPDVAIQELDRELILMLSNPPLSNNYNEEYAMQDIFNPAPDSLLTPNGYVALTEEEKRRYSTYVFEGYQIYQLRDNTVGTSDLEDPDKARLVAQVDIANNVEDLINFERDPTLGQDIPVKKVDAENQGIRHSFRITEDLFAEGDNRLVNHKTYYFMAIAYAYNAYGDGFGNLSNIASLYDPSSPDGLSGQKLPYLPSRTSATGPVRVYTGVPHKVTYEDEGIIPNASYGDGVEITRIEGAGNSNQYLQMKQESLEALFEDGPTNDFWGIEHPVYEAGMGPVDIMVVDPLNIVADNFTIKFRDSTSNKVSENTTWVMYGDTNFTDSIYSERAIVSNNEQIVLDLGLSIAVNYGFEPTHPNAVNNGFIGFQVNYEDNTDQWLFGVVDADNNEHENWIKSGDMTSPNPELEDHFNNFNTTAADVQTDTALDPDQHFENIANRTWAPFALSSYDTNHPVPTFGFANGRFAERILGVNNFSLVPGVDIVITKDKSKWTRCPVFEAQDNPILSDGGAIRGTLRRALSVDKNGLNQLDVGVNLEEATFNGEQILSAEDAFLLDTLFRDGPSDTLGSFAEYFFNKYEVDNLTGYSYGMGWFPGYAIDVETGERLNMAFSESSDLKKDNGDDMVWNPTSSIYEGVDNQVRFGGIHMVYVFRNNVVQADSLDPEYVMPSYDGGTFAFNQLKILVPKNLNAIWSSTANQKVLSVYRAGAWVGYPLLAENKTLFGEQEDGNDVTIQLRAAKNYRLYASGNRITTPENLATGTYYVARGGVTNSTDTIAYEAGDVFSFNGSSTLSFLENTEIVLTQNNGFPMYTFNTANLAPTKGGEILAEGLDDIVAVPNPYYAYSKYETGRLDYRIKIVNLPPTCDITIYTINGSLVRTFHKDDNTTTHIDWDLLNQNRIRIASGVYLIHVNVPGVGEKVIKWFGALRPTDLTAF